MRAQSPRCTRFWKSALTCASDNKKSFRVASSHGVTPCQHVSTGLSWRTKCWTPYPAKSFDLATVSTNKLTSRARRRMPRIRRIRPSCGAGSRWCAARYLRLRLRVFQRSKAIRRKLTLRPRRSFQRSPNDSAKTARCVSLITAFHAVATM